MLEQPIPARNIFSEITSRTSQEVQRTFAQCLADFPREASEVQGYMEYNFIGFECRNPLQVNNLLGPRFWRNFDPSLKAAISSVKDAPRIDKPNLHRALLEKYLGIRLTAESVAPLIIQGEPNAYHSVPAENSEDDLLHLNFLQPFSLLGIADRSRKNIWGEPSVINRAWFWHESAPNTDTAPLFRKIVQAYILAEILQDYAAENAFQDPIVRAKLEELSAAHQALISDISLGWRALFTGLRAPQMPRDRDVRQMQGNRAGITDTISTRRLDNTLPGVLDVASHYPVGRLLFGQPSVEVHHQVALRAASRHQGKHLRFAFVYVLNWLLAHLNIPTSFFWPKVALGIAQTNWRALKSYITNPQREFRHFLRDSFLLVPNLLLLAMTPLLILVPWIYGLTGIPFTLLRTFCMVGPINKLRHFKILKLIDVGELVKDSVLFFAYALPFSSIILGVLNMLLPAALLGIGAWISFMVLVVAWASIFRSVNFPLTSLLSDTQFFRFLGASIFLGLVAYLGLGVLGRQIYAIAPGPCEWAMRALGWVLSPLGMVVYGIGKVFTYFAGETRTVDRSNIIPEALRQANQPLPMESDALVIPEAVQAEIDTLVRQMSSLNQSPHLSVERKRLFSECLSNLDTEKSGVTLPSLQAAMGTARGLLENNFTRAEADRMLALVTSLQAGADATQAPILRSERTGIMMKRGTNNYQPSWQMIQLMRRNQMPIEGIPSEKCDRIQRLRTGVV